jgi:hypothetical protein
LLALAGPVGALAQAGTSFNTPILFLPALVDGSFTYSDTQTFNSPFSDVYHGGYSRDVIYAFTVGYQMNITATQTGSLTVGLYLLSGPTNALTLVTSSNAGSLTATVPAGLYHVVSEALDNAVITTTISGTMAVPQGDTRYNPIIFGTLQPNTTYTDTEIPTATITTTTDAPLTTCIIGSR